MTVGGVEVVSKRRFVTLVDPILSLSHAERCISSGEDAAFGFTESEEVVHLQHGGDFIAVTSSKCPWRVAVEREELASALSKIIRETYSHLTSGVPGLVADSVIRKVLPE